MNDVMRVRGPGELVAAIPHLLGFVPEDSVVCVPLGGGPVARLDLPHDEEDIGPSAAVLAAPYLRDRLDVAVVSLTDDRVAAEKMSLALRRRLVGHVRVPLVLWVDNNTWTDLTTGHSGDVPEATRKQLAAEAVFGGRRLPAGSREALAAEIQPDPVQVAEVAKHLPQAMTSTRRLSEAGRLEDEADWVRDTIHGFCRTQRPLDDETAARLLADMAVPELRDCAWLLMNQPDATRQVALWADLTRRSPEEVRTPAASLLAFASWLDGNGARARVALDLLPDHDQADYPLAAITALALDQAIPPSQWDTHRAATEPPTPVSQVALQRAYLNPRPDIDREERDHPAGGHYREGPASPGR